jgi:hypothetical protein
MIKLPRREEVSCGSYANIYAVNAHGKQRVMLTKRRVLAVAHQRRETVGWIEAQGERNEDQFWLVAADPLSLHF